MQGFGLIRGPIKPKTGLQANEWRRRRQAARRLDALAPYTNSFEFTLSPHKLSGEAEKRKKCSKQGSRLRLLSKRPLHTGQLRWRSHSS